MVGQSKLIPGQLPGMATPMSSAWQPASLA